MSKAILIIDKPESCHKCPLFSSPYSDMTCRGNGKTIDYPYPDDKVQEWCPLKEIPEKKNLDGLEGRPLLKAQWTGWNQCIDEILAEKKE